LSFAAAFGGGLLAECFQNQVQLQLVHIRYICVKTPVMSLNINIPDSIALSPFELSMNLAAKLFDRGLITSGQGAEMVGLSKRDFIKLLGKYEVSVFQYSMDEVLEDLENIKHARNI
jgi:predicted HTH domain antitoxin